MTALKRMRQEDTYGFHIILLLYLGHFLFLSLASTSEMALQPLTRIRMLMGILTITRGKSNPANTCQIP